MVPGLMEHVVILAIAPYGRNTQCRELLFNWATGFISRSRSLSSTVLEAVPQHSAQWFPDPSSQFPKDEDHHSPSKTCYIICGTLHNGKAGQRLSRILRQQQQSPESSVGPSEPRALWGFSGPRQPVLCLRSSNSGYRLSFLACFSCISDFTL